jgi:hypothetical protein
MRPSSRREPGDRFASPGDFDLFAALDGVEEGEEFGLCFGGGYLSDHMVMLLVI